LTGQSSMRATNKRKQLTNKL